MDGKINGNKDGKNKFILKSDQWIESVTDRYLIRKNI
jgi:hypothetical protein